MTLHCFSPVLWLVEWLLKTICSWGSPQSSPQAALVYCSYEFVFEMLQRTQRWCMFTATGQQLCPPAQLRSRCFCCQLHFQISTANATILIPRTYKYLHHDWHVVVFLITTSSFPLTSGQTNSDCHRLEYYISKECIYFKDYVFRGISDYCCATCNEQAMGRSPGGDLSHEVPFGLQLCAATGCQPRATQSWSLGLAWPDPTPEPNSQIKLGQLT